MSDVPQPSDYEDLDDYYDACLNDYPCPECGEVGLHFDGPIELSNGKIHDSRYSRRCGHSLPGAWYREKPRSKEQAKTRRPRRGKHRLAAPLGTDKCFICHRTRDELRLLGVELEEAHEDDYADLIDADQPDDPRRHAWLCTKHHRIQELETADAERYRKLLTDEDENADTA